MMMHKQTYLFYWCFLASVFAISSCKKYLDTSPDKSLTTPSVAQDLRAILDYNNLMNGDYPAYGAIASDDYYLTDENYNALGSSACKEYYVWGLIDEPTDQIDDWLFNYERIFYLNVVLDYVDKVDLNGMTQKGLDAIKGEALFYRGYSHFLLSQTFAMPYNPATAADLPGVPLRLTSDINQKVTRPTIKADFSSILDDLQQASTLLPENSTVNKLRPSRPAAFAAMANVYLVMQQYSNAEKMAGEALKMTDSLMDYNKIDPNQTAPIPVSNKEVIWQADLSIKATLSTIYSFVDTVFYHSFSNADNRKYLFFNTTGDIIKFKGHYNGQYHGTATYFCGFAVDELYLIQAETAARLGNLNEAATALNILAKNRFFKEEFVPFTFTNQQEAIKSIMDMRRKELCFRGIYRWMDIRRLSQIPGEEITLQRTLLGQTYTLKPGNLHYAFLFPQTVIDNSDMQQNAR